MKVVELIKLLQSLGIENQNLPVTCFHDDFPHNVKSLQIEDATMSGDHWWISYCPEIDKEDGGDVRKIVTIRVY